MIPLGFSWGAFFVYVMALVIVTGGGLLGLFASGHPAFLAPTLMGLFYFFRLLSEPYLFLNSDDEAKLFDTSSSFLPFALRFSQ